MSEYHEIADEDILQDNALGLTATDIRGHARMFVLGESREELLIRLEDEVYPSFRSEPGLLSVALTSEDLNCIEAISQKNPLTIIVLDLSLNDLLSPIDHFGHEEVEICDFLGKEHAMEWAEYLERLAASIRQHAAKSRVSSEEPADA